MRFLLQFYFGLIDLTTVVGFMAWEASLYQFLIKEFPSVFILEKQGSEIYTLALGSLANGPV